MKLLKPVDVVSLCKMNDMEVKDGRYVNEKGESLSNCTFQIVEEVHVRGGTYSGFVAVARHYRENIER